MFDVFYLGRAPGLFPHEQSVVTIEEAFKRSRTRYCWVISYLCDYTGWDWLWEPSPWQSNQRHAWASQWQKDSGTYLVPKLGFEDTHYHAAPVITRLPDPAPWQDLTDDWDASWHPDATDPPLIYQFGTQWQKTGGPRYLVPGAQDIKYVAEPRVQKTSRDAHWSVPSGTDVSTFDWTWHPDATDPPYIYQFGTQHQRTGGPVYTVPGATDVKYVDQIRIQSQRVATAIIEIDHLDGRAGSIPGTTRTVRYFDNYLDTLRRIAKNIGGDHEFVWICSTICDYTNFDFSWHPEQWQATMLHVFASDGEKFGDTFFMHVPTFQYRADTCQLLEWYDVNFVQGISVPRRPLPVIRHQQDSHVEPIKTQTWSGPLAVFAVDSAELGPVPAVPLWREKTKTVVPLSPGASAVIVPRIAVPQIRTQVYDYPHVLRGHHTVQDRPLDIVFISNGESNAEQNWQSLQQSTAGRTNQIHRITNVNGRVAAYQAAAEISSTPWFFAVFAKLETDPGFDWSWQPDRLQQAKHYIFHARNPVNGLEYGHQAMIAYNRCLTLANTGQGLDFTLDQEHEVVPMLSGTAWYADSAWMAWRTAFREALKLRHSLPDVENEYRLSQWLKENHNDGHAKWSHLGAQDAMCYYDEVAGDFAALKKSYEWSWLANRASEKRNLSPDR